MNFKHVMLFLGYLPVQGSPYSICWNSFFQFFKTEGGSYREKRLPEKK